MKFFIIAIPREALLRLFFFIILFTSQLVPENLFAQKKGKEPDVTIEQVAEKCKGLPKNQRVVVKVARFSVSTKSAQANSTFGDELATMLTSALQQTNCFRVMETNKNVSDATGEMAFAQDGFTNGSGPQAGQMLGAQLVVTGEITDFSEGSSETNIMGVGKKSNKATVGFTLKVLNPQTGELLFSKDVNMQGSNSGKAFDLFGVKTSSSTENRAVQDATQKAIIKAVEILAGEKDNMEIPEPVKPKEIKHYTAQNCNILKSGSPKVIILVTEATTAGTARGENGQDLDRREREMYLREQEANSQLARELVSSMFKSKKRRLAEEDAAKNKPATTTQTSATAEIKKVVIEQTATETELTRHFVEAGFRVVDPKVYGKMRQVSDSIGDLGQLAALGLKMGADIIITGQAISERTNAQGGMTASRARLEIRVIATEDGSILATNTVSAGGTDVSEAVANKVAIRNASENMAQYLMERLCGMNIQFAGGSKTNNPVKTVTNAVSEVLISNVSFGKLQILAAALSKNPKVKSVKKSIKGTEGTLTIEHIGSTDELIEALEKLSTVKFEVAELQEGNVKIMML